MRQDGLALQGRTAWVGRSTGQRRGRELATPEGRVCHRSRDSSRLSRCPAPWKRALAPAVTC